MPLQNDTCSIDELFIGKPDCFAIPAKFHGISQKCETCKYCDQCGATVAELVDAIDTGAVSGKNELRSPMRNYKIGIEYWDNYTAEPLPKLSKPQLEQLSARAILGEVRHQAELHIKNKKARAADTATAKADAEAYKIETDRLIEDLFPDEESAEGDNQQVISKTLEVALVDAQSVIGAASASSISILTKASLKIADETVSSPSEPTISPSASASVTSGVVAIPGYSFAGTKKLGYYRVVNTLTLIEELRKIKNRFENNGVSYPEVREDYCAINRILNEQQLACPSFRPHLPLPKKKTSYSPDSQLLARDRKIIDLEWLHIAGFPNKLDDETFSSLLCAEIFDFELAGAFVSKLWKNDARLAILALTKTEQIALSTILSVEVRKKVEGIRSKARVVRLKIKDLAARSPRLRLFIDDYTNLWMARGLCKGQSQELIGKVHGWLQGQSPLAPSTISEKLNRLEKLLK